MRHKDQKLHPATQKIIQEVVGCDNPAFGIGKAEPLKPNLLGFLFAPLESKSSNYLSLR